MRNRLLVVLLPMLFASTSYATELDNSATTLESSSLTESFIDFHIETYQHFKQLVSQFYESTDFNPNICNSYFATSELSSVIALPLLITPGESVQFEVFGQLYDSRDHYLSNMDRNAMMYGFHYDSAISDSNLNNAAMGFGLSYKLSDSVDMKTLYSTGYIPGLGLSNLAVSMEYRF